MFPHSHMEPFLVLVVLPKHYYSFLSINYYLEIFLVLFLRYFLQVWHQIQKVLDDPATIFDVPAKSPAIGTAIFYSPHTKAPRVFALEDLLELVWEGQYYLLHQNRLELLPLAFLLLELQKGNRRLRSRLGGSGTDLFGVFTNFV